ncbi:adenosylcobinamide-phosphate synthase [Paenibacillus sophorae]|uniref:Cobalamin biosynthesis protein CobD n=1 Tax=Paenibacillus sophorae TaxID=1333845 RepID=A0A1H8MQS1_9BACL|nr:adenosylcobinamide-phosphate synthase CbiB [Paenibacillus sophorae]QWU17909.1 adenosylcobinamide-phosphate synthase CbiB [Paenibacillus sophorae]SEO19620.1 adenosylcobinamide-phosphate synthase [Paenibacillus sophorae]
MFVITAIVIDLLVGDPRGIPHPVIGIGKIISATESALRKWGTGRARERALGVLLVLVVLSAVYAAAFLILWLAGLIHPIFRSLAEVWLISTTIAIKGLGDAAMQVFRPLAKGDLDSARTYVGYIVGRETHALSEREVTRATVETVAENIVDAVVAPLFYALLGGAPLALLYRAVNTLDSMVGYKNDKYRYFGWASARLDDVLNYIPARITGLLLWAAALTTKGLNAGRAWQAMRRDAAKHPSPNSGIPEAAVAGALGIQLGGFNSYGGIVSERARMGTAIRELAAEDIRQTIKILRLTAALIMILLLLAAGSLFIGEIK